MPTVTNGFTGLEGVVGPYISGTSAFDNVLPSVLGGTTALESVANIPIATTPETGCEAYTYQSVVPVLVGEHRGSSRDLRQHDH